MRTFESEPMQTPIPRSQMLDRHEAVAEVRLGGRAGADAGAGVADQVELARVGVRGVDDGRAARGSRLRASSSTGRTPCSARHSSISRGCSSAWTWSGRPSRRRSGRAPRASRPGRRARSGGRRRRERLTRAATRAAQVVRGGGLAKAGEAAAPVRGEEQDEHDPGLGGRSRPRAPRRGRGSGTRRRPCSRPRAARGRRRRTRGARARASGRRRARASSRARPRSRRPRCVPAARAGRRGSARSRSPGS